jgi:putative SOS response-associated peptidase YedK
MCGRFALRTSLPEIARLLGLDAAPPGVGAAGPRYNVAPSQSVLALRRDGAVPGLGPMRWGLIPRWARDRPGQYRMINARAETVAEKPAFRDAFRRRRCLVPADGYYEWQAGPTGKQPWFFHLADDRPFCFAGIYEAWQEPDGHEVTTCAIVTTVASALCAPVHHRMPVIVPRDAQDPWLDPAAANREFLLSLLVPYAADDLRARPVSTFVNSPGNDDARCVARLEESPAPTPPAAP